MYYYRITLFSVFSKQVPKIGVTQRAGSLYNTIKCIIYEAFSKKICLVYGGWEPRALQLSLKINVNGSNSAE